MNTLGQDFAMMYGRELDRLAGEIAAYRSDADLWSTVGAQKNSPGTLAIHLVGALAHFIGGTLGGSSYVRDREREFSERDVPRAEVERRIRECRETVVRVLEGLDDAAMNEPLPGKVPPSLQGITTRAFLLHMFWHIGWHSGHVYYHRLGIAEPPADMALE